MKVMKFGGAAMKDAEAIAHAAGIVAGQTGACAVVVSAMAGVTDLLQQAIDNLPSGAETVDNIVAAITAIHQPAATRFEADISLQQEELERLLYGISYTQEVSPRLHDLVLSLGEQMAAPIMAAAICKAGKPAASMDAATVGLATLGPYANARPDLPAQAKLVPRAIKRLGKTPVITGFYGVDSSGHPTLFGRGGSDFVAALVARATKADVLELWKDVPGFLTADPKSVPNAASVPELDYEEAAELAYFGAKILHARCVEPVQDVGIPIHVRPLHDLSAPGTMIRRDCPPAPQRVRSAASRGELAILRLSGPGMAETPGIAARVFAALEAHDVPVLNLANSQATFALLIADRNAERAETAMQPFVGGTIQKVEVLRGRALVCVVGRGLGEVPGSAARILRSVSDAGVNVEMISLGASEIAIDFIVKETDQKAALRGIHEEFLEGAA